MLHEMYALSQGKAWVFHSVFKNVLNVKSINMSCKKICILLFSFNNMAAAVLTQH